MWGGVKVSDKPPDLGARSMYLRHPGLRHENLYPKIFINISFHPDPATRLRGGGSKAEAGWVEQSWQGL